MNFHAITGKTHTERQRDKVVYTTLPPLASEQRYYKHTAWTCYCIQLVTNKRINIISTSYLQLHDLSFGAHTFHVAATKIWNTIPLHIRQSQTYSSFRRHL